MICKYCTKRALKDSVTCHSCTKRVSLARKLNAKYKN